MPTCPDIHHIFSITKGARIGTCSTVSGIDEAINTQWSDRLHLLAAAADQSRTLLGGDVFANLLTELRAVPVYRH
jgi:hypothetical protein